MIKVKRCPTCKRSFALKNMVFSIKQGAVVCEPCFIKLNSDNVSPKQKFDLDEEFKQYLELMQLNEGRMPLDQLTETKRAFIGGIAQLYIFLVSTASDLTDDEAAEAMLNIKEQLSVYWEVEVDKSV